MRFPSYAARLAAGAVWLALSCEVLQGQEPAPREPVRVARLVERLGSASFQDRSDAARELAALGPEGRAELERAAASSDPEIRLRAEQLLRRIKLAAFWQEVPYRGTHRQESTSKIVARLSEATGNRLLVDSDLAPFREAVLDLSPNSVGEGLLQPANSPVGEGFWPWADRICRASGNRIRPTYPPQPAGLVLVEGPLGNAPVAYAGPIRGQVTTIRRAYTEEVDLETGEADITHTFRVNLSYLWEDRCHLVAFRTQPRLVEAVTDTGERLTCAHAVAQAWNVVGRGSRTLSNHLMLHPPATAAKTLDRLSLAWGLIAVGEYASLDIAGLEEPTVRRQEGIELAVERCARSGDRWEVVLVVNRDLAIPEPEEILFVENQVELWDGQRRPFTLGDQTGTLTARGVRLSLWFAAPTAESVPRALRFSYPTLRAQQDVELKFRGVPLPRSRPQ